VQEVNQRWEVFRHVLTYLSQPEELELEEEVE
jgi:hypothetical protein